jgi:hypothetical protein
MDSKIIHYVRLARGAQAGGYYGLGKLLWALAFSEEIKQSSAAGIPRDDALLAEITALAADLRASGADAGFLSALEGGIASLKDNTTARYAEIPDVRVSRFTGDIYVGDTSDLTADGDDAMNLRLMPAIHYFELMSPADVMSALHKFPITIAATIENMTEAQLDAHPFAGEWSLRELLFHFTFAQELLHSRVEQMIAADNPTLKGLAVWALQDDPSVPTSSLLARYRESRLRTLEILAALPAGDWWRTGYHDEFGPVTILSTACYFARHERSHMAQFMALVNAT